MTAILKERNEFTCFPDVSGVPLFSVVNYPKSQKILINPDILGVVGPETILKHQGSNSLGYYCDQLNVRTSQCGLNGKKCEQIPGSSVVNPEKISDTLFNTNQYHETYIKLECRPLGPDSLPTYFEIPGTDLNSETNNGTIGRNCPEFVHRDASCGITLKPCSNFNSKK